MLMARIENGVKTLYTPEPNHGILPGTTQGAIFEAARRDGWELGYGPLYPQDLFESDGVWLASSVRLLAPGYAPERYGVSARCAAHAPVLGIPGTGLKYRVSGARLILAPRL